MENVIILGTGAAGLTAAIYTARAGLSPLVLEGLEPGGQLTTTTEVENFPGFPEGIDGPELMQKMHAQAERFGARFAAATIIGSELKPGALKITADDGTTYQTRTLIVATGASAKYIGLPHEQKLIGRGVTSCATCDGAFFKNVPVAVVGGGDTAMEEAVFLTRFASTVHLIHRRDSFRASKIMAERAAVAHPGRGLPALADGHQRCRTGRQRRLGPRVPRRTADPDCDRGAAGRMSVASCGS